MLIRSEFDDKYLMGHVFFLKKPLCIRYRFAVYVFQYRLKEVEWTSMTDIKLMIFNSEHETFRFVDFPGIYI